MLKAKIIIFIFAAALAHCANYDLVHKLENPDGDKNPITAKTTNYIFVSSWTTQGDMSGTPFPECAGLAGHLRADCGCTRAAAANNLLKSVDHKFYAWLSSATPASDAICRLQGGANGCGTVSTMPYFNTRGSIVAANLNSLISTNLQNGIIYSETGTDYGADSAWTGTLATGLIAANHCESWSVTATTPATNGNTGNCSSQTTTWSSLTVVPCTNFQRVYCLAAP